MNIEDFFKNYMSALAHEDTTHGASSLEFEHIDKPVNPQEANNVADPLTYNDMRQNYTFEPNEAAYQTHLRDSYAIQTAVEESELIRSVDALSSVSSGVIDNIDENNFTLFRPSTMEGLSRHSSSSWKNVDRLDLAAPFISSEYPVKRHSGEISKAECLRIALKCPHLSKRAIMEIPKSEEQDIYSKVYFEVESSMISPQRTSKRCRRIYEEEVGNFQIGTNIEVRNKTPASSASVFQAKEKKPEWIPVTISKSIGQERANSTSNQTSLCGMINFRNKGAWKRKSSEDVRLLKLGQFECSNTSDSVRSSFAL